MHRFFVNSSDINDTHITITGSDANHIINVLRLSVGDNVEICDCNCNDYLCSIESFSKGNISLKINNKYPSHTEPSIDITLYQGIPKSDKMEYIIQKSIELGVKRIVPVETTRSVVKIKDSSKKVQRWQKISDEACKQCKRGILPEISSPVSFKDAVSSLDDNCLNILAYENEKDNSLKQVLNNNNFSKINIFIGPEGGFDDEEINFVKEKNFKIITLGPRILRTETAPLALISAIMYDIGDW